MQKATPKMVEQWKKTYNEYRTKLKPNNKSAIEVLEYLEKRYPLRELNEEKLKQVVIGNVLGSNFYKQKLPESCELSARVFIVQNEGRGKSLYEKQDKIFLGTDIFVGIELNTGFFHVEGSSLLWDELFAYRGLDKDDINNFYLVYEYISCLKKFDMLEDMLRQMDL